MRKLIALSALAMFMTQANAFDLSTLKDAVKSTSSNSTANTNAASNTSGVNSLTNTEASGGLKEALTQGVGKAVASLGAADGFLAIKM